MTADESSSADSNFGMTNTHVPMSETEASNDSGYTRVPRGVCHFLKLPVELRRYILGYLLPKNLDLKFWPSRHWGISQYHRNVFYWEIFAREWDRCYYNDYFLKDDPKLNTYSILLRVRCVAEEAKDMFCHCLSISTITTANSSHTSHVLRPQPNLHRHL